MTSPSGELRAAAETIRTTASKADPGPWCADWVGQAIRDVRRNGEFECDTHSLVMDEHGNLEGDPECRVFGMYDGRHVAMWHPGVALLVADILDLAALDGWSNDPLGIFGPELALARAINGSQP